MKKQLDVKNLNVTFKTQGQELQAVRGIDFSLFEGETLGIVGESGCGKSTVAKAFLQLLPKKIAEVKGEIWYESKNLMSLSESEMQRMRGKELGMIFQDTASSLNPTLKIGTQIKEGYRKHFPLTSQKEVTEIVYDILNKVGLSQEILEAYPYTLSGGMRQRAMIALALICKPKILLADEPTNALDLTIQSRILNFLKQNQKEMKTSILLITHDLGLAAQFCDRVLVMYAGKIIESAPVDTLFQNPQHPYTKGLFQAIPRPHYAQKYSLKPIEGRPPNLTLSINHCSFCNRCPDSMNICAIHSPPLFQTTEFHGCACFKNDPRYNP